MFVRRGSVFFHPPANHLPEYVVFPERHNPNAGCVRRIFYIWTSNPPCMKQIYTLAVIFSLLLPGRGYAQSLGISPDPTVHVQCPDIPQAYQISAWVEGCHSVEPPVNGTLIEEKKVGLKHQVTIRWNDSADPGGLTIRRSDSLNCTGVAPGRSWEIPIASVAGLTPDLTGPLQIPLLSFVTNRYSASLLHHQRGSMDPDPYPVTKFEWEAPPSWNIFLVDFNNSAAVNVFADTSEGCIKVRGQRACGVMSEWTTICPERVMDVPCPIFIFPNSLVCGDRQNIFANAPDFSFIMPEATYNWQVSDGWEIISDTFSANKAFVILKPDGIHSGTISATLSGKGKTSEPCVVTIPYLSDFADSKVQGPDELCSSGTYYLTDLPPNATIHWEVTNFNGATGPVPFAQTTGSGYLANLELTNPDAQGYYVIAFTASDVCGEAVKQKKFYVGKPRFYSAKIDGAAAVPQTLCPGNHRLEISVLGSDDCIEWSTNMQGYADCRRFDFWMPDAGSDCSELLAVSTNTCGSTEQTFPFCSQTGCPDSQTFGLMVSPNPANFVVVIEGTSSDESKSDLALIETLNIYNSLGQLVYSWNDTPRQRIVLPVDKIPIGTYIIQASVWGTRVARQLAISPKY